MINTVLTGKSGFAWIDVVNPSKEELDQIALTYGLHATAVLDCLDPEHLPKYERFGTTSFGILRAFDEAAPAEGSRRRPGRPGTRTPPRPGSPIGNGRRGWPAPKRARWSPRNGAPGPSGGSARPVPRGRPERRGAAGRAAPGPARSPPPAPGPACPGGRPASPPASRRG